MDDYLKITDCAGNCARAIQRILGTVAITADGDVVVI